MRTRALLTATCVATAMVGLAACGGSADPDTGANVSEDAVVKLRFQSLAFQPALVETNQAIVDSWNADNPDIQVELVQGDWGSVHDQLTASFEGGTAPDIFHYESDRVRDFAERGNVLDIEPYLSDELISDITDGAWSTVSYPGLEGVWGVPFLQEVWAVYADSAALDNAGVELPTVEDPWTWDDYAEIARELSVDEDGDGVPEVYGGAVPLGNPATRILPMAPAFGGKFFETVNGSVEVVFGPEERELVARIHEMLHEDRSISQDLLSLSPSNSLTGFVQGDYRTLVAPIHLRQALEEGAGEGFEWQMLPPLVGMSNSQAAVTQSFFVSADTNHPEEAVAFLEFLANGKNQADLARGDMLLPASSSALAELSDEEDESWSLAISAADGLEVQPYQQINGTEEWISRVATPALERYFAGSISMDELSDILINDGNDVLARYAR